MMRTISHLKVQMLMREGGQQRGTRDRVHTGHRKMARNPVSSSWLSQPGQIVSHVKMFLRAESTTRQEKNGLFSLLRASLTGKPSPNHSLQSFRGHQTPNSKSIIRQRALWSHLLAMSCSQLNREHDVPRVNWNILCWEIIGRQP